MADAAALLEVSVPLLGVPVTYASNSSLVITMVEQALGHWRSLPPPLVAATPPLRVTVVVGPAAAAESHGGYVYRAYGDTLLAARGTSLFAIHGVAGSALALISPALAADGLALRRTVIEHPGLLLVGHHERSPVRAAALVRDGLALLLTGAAELELAPLCAACIQAGFTWLARDYTWVSPRPRLRVWGMGGPPAASPARADEVRAAERVILCLVEPQTGQASRLEPLDTTALLAPLCDDHAAWLSPLQAQAAQAATALISAPAYRLAPGSDLTGAAALLAHLVRSTP